jgi:hypothetical protein
MKIDWTRIRFASFAAALAGCVAYLGQPYIHDNSQAIDVMVTVFSVLAGFLIAIIAIVGDPALLPPGTWRAAEKERSQVTRRLVRHKWLFVTYLLTLGVIFISLLVQKQFPAFALWLERIFLFFGAFAFLLSLQLPSALMRAQMDRIDMVIEHRKGSGET